ncbi:hypothetical protein LR48_Vigan09g094400 [Vigna angularis]|uniref:Uncharacterized protein n=1 Tax=Phaseolus angularis TaxID=3914 RepID=A0A0L9VB43_PHAAN|nr:hypothetical protein LR48_Vigan09g094400 [Vigna angularis]
MSLEESPTNYRANQSKHMQKRSSPARVRSSRTFRGDARPEKDKKGRSSKREESTLAREVDVRPAKKQVDARPEISGRSSKLTKRTFVPGSGRSSSQAEVDARPARQRTLVQVAERTLVQPDTRDARPCRRNERTLVHAEEDARPRTLVPEAGARPR